MRFRNKQLETWLKSLEKNDIIKSTVSSDGEQIKMLQPPLSIELSSNIVKKLIKNYKPNLEIGGVIFAEPILKHGRKILSVRKVKFLRNISDQQQKQYFAGEKMLETMHKALMGTKSGLRCFPICFHSHPQPVESSDQYYIIRKFIGFETSEADKRGSNSALVYPSLGISLLLPRSLIYMDNGELFIGFYGGKIAPEDFKEYMKKLTGKTIDELISFAKEFAESDEEAWKKVLSIGATFLASIGLKMAELYHPLEYATAIEILRNNPREIQTYFALTEGQGVKVYIPKPQKEKQPVT